MNLNDCLSGFTAWRHSLDPNSDRIVNMIDVRRKVGEIKVHAGRQVIANRKWCDGSFLIAVLSPQAQLSGISRCERSPKGFPLAWFLIHIGWIRCRVREPHPRLLTAIGIWH